MKQRNITTSLLGFALLLGGATLTTGAAKAAPVAPAPAAPRVSLAVEDGVEKATRSKIAPVALPADAHRSTAADDIAKFEDALQKIATAAGGRIGQVEVLIWQNASEKPMKALTATLKEAGYGYASESPMKSDGSTVTPFGAVRADKKGGLLGLWVEDGGYLLLAWGTFTGNGTAGSSDGGESTAAAPAPTGREEVLPAGEPEAEPRQAATPAGKVPADMLGAWSWTTISSVGYQNQTTGQLAEPSGMSTRFDFTKDGRYKFMFYVRQRTYNLVTESTTTSEGTVKFNGDGTFTLYPEKGHYKGHTGSKPLDRPMTAAERKPSHYAYEWRTEDGKRSLYVSPGKERSANMSRFKRAE